MSGHGTDIDKIDKLRCRLLKCLFFYNAPRFLNFPNIILLDSYKFILNVLYTDTLSPTCFNFILSYKRKSYLRYPLNFSLPIYKSKHKSLLLTI